MNNKLRAMRLMFIETPDATGNAASAAGAGTTPPPQTTTPDGDDKPLGEAGMRALQAEREQRKALTTELAALKAKLNGVQANQPKDSATEIAEIRAQLEATRLEATRERLARQHGLSDEHAALLEGDNARMAALAQAFAGISKAQPQSKLPDGFAGGANAEDQKAGTITSGREKALAELNRNKK
jgi:ElaB/YqjD/DUF883 family membrane-anchored ribosome-binding protein